MKPHPLVTYRPAPTDRFETHPSAVCFVEHGPEEVACQVDSLREIGLNGRWIQVTAVVFHAWCGERRMDGAPYRGPVYVYRTNVIKEA